MDVIQDLGRLVLVHFLADAVWLVVVLVAIAFFRHGGKQPGQ